MLTESMSKGLNFPATPIYPQDAAVGTYTTGPVDMYLFRRAMLTVKVGVFAPGSSVTAKLEQSNDPTFAVGISDVPNSGFVMAAAPGVGNNHLSSSEVNARRVTARYVRGNLLVAGGSVFLDGVIQGCNPASDPASQYDSAADVVFRVYQPNTPLSQNSIHGTSAIVNEL